MLNHRSYIALGSLLFLPLVSCDSDDSIKVYQVPKEKPAANTVAPSGGDDPHAGVPMPTPGAPDPHAGMTGVAAAAASKPTVVGETPKSWLPGRASSMRMASYSLKGAGGSIADISLISLAGTAGGVLDNVNRWRGQIGLAPVDEKGLADSSTLVLTPQGEAVMVDLIATTDVANPAQDGRILAALLVLDKEMWFYKMRGNAELVGNEKEAFITWMKTAKKVAIPAAQRPVAKPMTPTLPPVATGPVKPPAGVTWEVPDSWLAGAQSGSMRLATFLVTDPAGAKGEVTVIRLGGASGGELANVNRWRGQVGLGPITEAMLAKTMAQVDSVSGPISHVDCNGKPNSTVAAWCRQGASTWFFKLTGPAEVVAAERANFMRFLSSVNFTTK